MIEGVPIAVVIPAYNEAPLIASTLAGIPACVDHVIVVDDKSADETRAVVLAVSDSRVELIRHPENRGVGGALTSGYERAFDLGAEVAVVMAGDGQMDPRDLPALLLPILKGEALYTKGDRLSWPGARAEMPLLRWLGNHALSLLTRLATGLRVRDSQCGYTALHRSVAHSVDLHALWPRYGYPNDLLGRLALAGVPIRDVPVRPLYGDEVSGIGWRHALWVIPSVLGRVIGRRLLSAAPTARLELNASEGAREPEAVRVRGR